MKIKPLIKEDGVGASLCADKDENNSPRVMDMAILDALANRPETVETTVSEHSGYLWLQVRVPIGDRPARTVPRMPEDKCIGGNCD